MIPLFGALNLIFFKKMSKKFKKYSSKNLKKMIPLLYTLNLIFFKKYQNVKNCKKKMLKNVKKIKKMSKR